MGCRVEEILSDLSDIGVGVSSDAVFGDLEAVKLGNFGDGEGLTLKRVAEIVFNVVYLVF